ncbi:hypothetical protein QPX37_11405 [Corynebacterium accolens]|uniref:hypothetical protein n=2 Tax=Corynebacterium accolens TaxID=38284 RepID=UPI002543AEB9|nr:hypothetical protein [Corynebacterium accolens]MDK4276748.1 hypothetical protein [Corynebacterium accolens]
MLRTSNTVRGKLAELQVVAALESAGIATNLLTMDDNGLDISCQIPILPLTLKQRKGIRAGSPFTWKMSFETISIQIKSGVSPVKVRDLLGWDAANKSSPLGARIMAVWLEHKEPDVIWVFDPGAISSIVEGLSEDQASVALSAKAYKSAAVKIDCTKPEVLGRYLWLWSICPVALAEVWEKDILEGARNPTWPDLDELEDLAYEFLRWECRDDGPWAIQALFDKGGPSAGEAFLNCRNIFKSFYVRQGFEQYLNNPTEAESTVMDRLFIGGDVWADPQNHQQEGPANQWWTPPAVDRKSVVEQFDKLFEFFASEKGWLGR